MFFTGAAIWWRWQTILNEREWIDYAYGIAGTIGQMMRLILGAVMQLTNILLAMCLKTQTKAVFISQRFFQHEWVRKYY